MSQASPTNPIEEKTTSFDPSQKTILLVEDEENIRKLYQSLLETEGYQVELAADGTQAFQKIQSGGFDLVLLDIVLPEVGGLEILERLKEQENRAQSLRSIVLLTNLTEQEAIAQGIELGARGYLIKSDYDPDEFLQQIKDFLKN